MIDQLRAIAIFQAVAELGSFRQAAKKLGLSPSVVSHHVSTLEAHIGTALLYRSTRRMSLTDAGAELLSASQRMTAAALDGLAAIQARAERPKGTLTITVATALAHRPYVATFTRFARAYPDVKLVIEVADQSTPLEGSRFDVAIRGRTGDLDDSSYKVRKLGDLPLCVFASPDYVRGRPPLKTVDDLAEWDWIQSTAMPWSALGTTDPARTPRIVARCYNHTMARAFVFEGLGFMVETYPLVAEDVRAGRLVHLLPTAPLAPISIYAIYPANSPRTGLARLFVDFMMAEDWVSEFGFGSR